MFIPALFGQILPLTLKCLVHDGALVSALFISRPQRSQVAVWGCTAYWQDAFALIWLFEQWLLNWVTATNGCHAESAINRK